MTTRTQPANEATEKQYAYIESLSGQPWQYAASRVLGGSPSARKRQGLTKAEASKVIDALKK